jgi:hypothetical protein
MLVYRSNYVASPALDWGSQEEGLSSLHLVRASFSTLGRLVYLVESNMIRFVQQGIPQHLLVLLDHQIRESSPQCYICELRAKDSATVSLAGHVASAVALCTTCKRQKDHIRQLVRYRYQLQDLLSDLGLTKGPYQLVGNLALLAVESNQ